MPAASDSIRTGPAKPCILKVERDIHSFVCGGKSHDLNQDTSEEESVSENGIFQHLINEALIPFLCLLFHLHIYFNVF